MSSCKDKNNKSENESTLDRYRHGTESFLYRYRWWVVLVLALLLAYYLYTKKSGTSGLMSDASSSQGIINQGELNVAPPAQLGTEVRKFLRL
jgi:hypothetical protein